jgi:tyrosyl-tRNA synthetase
MFGKVMSISDELMWRYFELLSFRPAFEIDGFRRQTAQGANPRDAKFLLAGEIVTRFHGQAAGKLAHEAFVAQFQRGGLPDDIPEVQVSAPDAAMPLRNVIKEAGLTKSTSEASRMLAQGAVRVDGERLTDLDRVLSVGDTLLLQVGKRRFARVTVVASPKA